jgi:fatty-acyl-CoA synthase
LNLVAKRLNSGASDGRFDLSRVRTLICGGEPIHPRTARAFLEATEPFGFRPGALFPSYGLAECTVLVTAKSGLHVSPWPASTESDREDSSDAAFMMPAGAISVNLGKPALGTEIRVRAASGSLAAEGAIGEIEVKSASSMAGYFDEPLATARVLQEGWVRTGDLGFVLDGDLHCVGRAKEVIIVAGKNLVAPELERTIASAVDIELTRIACFASFAEAEGLCVVFESRTAEVAELARVISSACFDNFGITPADVIGVPIGALPKTTSGKVRRLALAEAYRAGEIS